MHIIRFILLILLLFTIESSYVVFALMIYLYCDGQGCENTGYFFIDTVSRYFTKYLFPPWIRLYFLMDSG